MPAETQPCYPPPECVCGVSLLLSVVVARLQAHVSCISLRNPPAGWPKAHGLLFN